jgi:hypothetical protein
MEFLTYRAASQYLGGHINPIDPDFRTHILFRQCKGKQI